MLNICKNFFIYFVGFFFILLYYFFNWVKWSVIGLQEKLIEEFVIYFQMLRLSPHRDKSCYIPDASNYSIDMNNNLKV